MAVATVMVQLLVTVALGLVQIGGMGTQAGWPEADTVSSAQMERPGSPSLLGLVS